MKNDKCTVQSLAYGKKTEKRGKRGTNTVGPGIWRETLKKVENENCTLQDLVYGDKPGERNKYEKHTRQNLEYGEKQLKT